MPFINVATAWKELSTSRVVANETQPLRESPPQIITEEASIISTNEVIQYESKPQREKEQNVSEAIRRARENFLNAVKSVSINSGQNNNNQTRTVGVDDGKLIQVSDPGSLHASRGKLESTKWQLMRRPTTSAVSDGTLLRSHRVGKASKRKSTTDLTEVLPTVLRRERSANCSSSWMVGDTTSSRQGGCNPEKLPSLRSVISGSISALRNRWSSAVPGSTGSPPPATGDMVTLRIQNGRVAIHQLPDEQMRHEFDGLLGLNEDYLSPADSPQNTEPGCQTIPACDVTNDCIIGEPVRGQRISHSQLPSSDEVHTSMRNIQTEYGCQLQLVDNPICEDGTCALSSGGNNEWPQYSLNDRSATDCLMPCSAASPQTATDYLEEAGAADVIFDALITLISE
ncbi:hypothetical protein LSH36_220g05043 [Paralvinella palmiformis]|uniref:Uncharacterized protein n=1 Tax=Paralvinella palmiformis TaxID=53620 RepID=A0AAD9JMX4_9ANNE|nr:hypothetical protein LSH36_220g05043 [Paralvinella palmiformis]